MVLASGNTGKLREFRRALEPLGIRLRAQSEFTVPAAAETGMTFVENAIIKARNAAEHCGLAALGDDSGLRVDALGGAPGIWSSRYAGPRASDLDNNQKLLRELADGKQRGASFVCVLALLQSPDDPTPQLFQGQWRGAILTQAHGAGGFGYDPLFLVPGHNCSAAELSPDEKNRISHRGRAIAALLGALGT